MIIFETEKIRLTLITSKLLRTETGNFTDLPTQVVQNREFVSIKYEMKEDANDIHIHTADVHFCVSKQNADVRYVIFANGDKVTDFEAGKLPGTARTLDQANGAVKLEKGITSRSGASVMDDSKSLLLHEDGSISSRPACLDRYWFAYGHAYIEQLRDFFKLTNPVPLIPKYALGNWWSRYRAYTQEEYRGLMQQFIDKKLPITVATIDMDWHWTDVIERFGKEAKSLKPTSIDELIYYFFLQGWTGYSWNTELFPDYKELLQWLHNNDFHITLNVHPSQGVRFFEDGYQQMCDRLGKDASSKECIPFDVTDLDFMKAYFEVLHHPLEEDGVDFWWIDWQQGKKTKVEGLDPLWALNHYHTCDSARGESRPLILSRYAGLGSHRYPLGFSGDTHTTWESLDFQPYFTNCAANAGYTWWSHDIGGHMLGIQDDELYIRWLQYGVFSPINRLHSSNSDFMGKEPWKRSWAVNAIAERFLRLRHKIIPYLYSANYRTHVYGEPICMPMYYRYDCKEAYDVKNQYIFGGQMLVCPITTPADKRLNLASVAVWLPEGRWTDIFNNRIYKGGGWVKMYRDMDEIPVLVSEGTILPMYREDTTNSLSLEQPLEIQIWRGNGFYELYEDDGETNAYENGQSAITSFVLEEQGNKLRLTITPPKDAKNVLPEERKMYIQFRDVDIDEIEITVGSESVVIEKEYTKCLQNEDVNELKNNVLTRVQANNNWKSRAFKKSLPKFVSDVINEFASFEK